MDELIIQFFFGKTSSEEEIALKNWISENEQNAKYFENKRNNWIATSQMQSRPGKNEDEVLHSIHERIIEKENRFKRNRYTQNRAKIPQFVKIAAAILIVFILGSGSTLLIYKNIIEQNKVTTCLYEAPKGSRAKAILPDGTNIWLNAGSKLIYKTDFNKTSRNVKLIGEAYFHVKTNPSKPFIVDANGLQVKAFGTSFNVKAYPEENKITTTLVEGKVEIEGKNYNDKLFSIKMNPREKVIYYKDIKQVKRSGSSKITDNKKLKNSGIEKMKSIPKSIAPVDYDINVKTVLYTSWKDKRWVVESEELDNLAVMLERRYNVNISFSNNELKKYRFSGTIENETLEQIFNIMSLTIPLSFDIDKGNVVLKIDPKLKAKYKSAYQKTL